MAEQDTLGAINNAVVEALQHKDILPDVNDPGSIKNLGITQRLAEHLIPVLVDEHFPEHANSAYNKDVVQKTLTSLTSNINDRRKELGKGPVSDALVQEAIDAGWKKVTGVDRSKKQAGEESLVERNPLKVVADRLGLAIPEKSTGVGMSA